MKSRVVEPELLDSLAPDDPGAQQNRKELRVINAIIGSHAWMRAAIHRVGRQLSASPIRVLELGAGDDSLFRQVTRSSAFQWEWTCLDMIPTPPGIDPACRWRQGNVLTTTWPECDLVVANMFLHHLKDAEFTELRARIPHSARAFLSCDPARFTVHRWQFALLRLGGMHPVTWHDGCLSIQAGFRRGELPKFFPGWQAEDQATFRGVLRFTAWREAVSRL
ncbi:MAG: hypothetical protein ACFCU3_06610 [Verrucomicrobiales bacterium]